MSIKNKIDKSITYWRYDELYGNKDLKDETYIDMLIDSNISDIAVINAFCYCAFLNMVFQTEELINTINLTLDELEYLKVKPKSLKNGILFHRTNLLFLAALLARKSKPGHILVTGYENKDGAKIFIKVLSLINSKLVNPVVIEEEKNILVTILRDYPYCYNPAFIKNFYVRWLKRYWYIYNVLLTEIPDNQKSDLCKSLVSLEEKSRLKLSQQFYILVQLLGWFLFNNSEEKNDNKTPNEHNKANSRFHKCSTDSFYLDAKKFPHDSSLFKFIENGALDLAAIYKHFVIADKEDKDKNRDIIPFYNDLLRFFDYPFFKIRNGLFCIIDFKFLMEGCCAGLLWKLEGLKEPEFPKLSAQYGNLLHKYFDHLFGMIFGATNNSDRPGKPDAIISAHGYEIIFEFTTEYYRKASLYNLSSNGMMDDLHKLLFNSGKNDRRARGKKDLGKLIKIERYLKESCDHNPDTKKISILVTERCLGDYSLLNYNDYLKNEICTLGLTNLMHRPPLILCLDDLELIWAFLDPQDRDNSIKKFIECIEKWENCTKEKFYYNFSFFLIHHFKDLERSINNTYDEFFKFSNLINDIKGES